MKPKGKLLIIGGAEDKADHEAPDVAGINAAFERFEILKELLPSGRHQHRIEVITTASEVPDEARDMYEKTFKKIGFHNIGFIDIRDKMQAREPDFYQRVADAAAVLFTGGNQFRLSTILGGTEIASLISEKYMRDSNFIVAGTSAGAMVMSKIMISAGGTEEVLVDHDLQTVSGLGLLENCIIDTHFIKRGRFGRLAHAVMINPGQLGVGLGEDTALIISNGFEAECRGSGMVVIIDGKDIEHTNITDAEPGQPVYVENLRVHLLVKKNRFDLKARRLANPPVSPSKENQE